MNKHLLQITDLTADDIKKIIEYAFMFKNAAGESFDSPLHGKTMAMIFEKPSLRTKVAFEIAAHDLGVFPIFLSREQILLNCQNESGRESISDIGKNLERYCNLILIRSYSHQTIQILANSVNIPVINALCNHHHPTQALADLMAIMWHKPSIQDLKIAFIGDGNNVARSLLQICALMGLKCTIASPNKYQIPLNEQYFIQKIAKKSQAEINFMSDPEEAAQDADIIYTDTFVSMGQETEKKQRLKIFKPYQITEQLFKKAKSTALFMHCLPAHRGEEVTDEVIDSSKSIVFDQAECRLHIAKALLTFYLS